MLFSSFFTLRPRPKIDFRRFLCFVGRRRAFFRDFRVSSTADERFFANSAFRRPPTGCFQHFSRFQGVGKLLFSVFRSSKGLESQFFLFFVHPRPRKAVFSIFCSSEGSDALFLPPLLQLDLIFKPNSWNKWLSWSFVQIWNVFV